MCDMTDNTQVNRMLGIILKCSACVSLCFLSHLLTQVLKSGSLEQNNFKLI